MIIRAVLLALLLFVYGPVAANVLVDCWNDDNYSYGVLVPFLVLWLLWRRRHDNPPISKRSATLLTVFAWTSLLAGVALFVIGNAAAEQFTLRCSGVAVVVGLTGIWGGPLALRRYGMPLLLLVAMVPLPYTVYYRLSFPLQLLSARIAAGSLDMIGLDVVRWGNIFEVNGHPLEVVRACSGIRSMMTLGTMAAALGVTLAFRPWAGATLLALSAPIAMIGNSVRLIVTALLVLQFGPQMSEGWQHDAVGFLGFAISLLLLGALAKRLRHSAAATEAPESHEQVAPGEVTRRVQVAAIVQSLRVGWRTLQPRSVRAAWLAVALFAGGATYGMVLRSHTVVPQRQSNLQAFPLELPGLQGEELGLSSRILEQVGVDDYLFRVYNAVDSPKINLYVGYYRSQRQGSQIHSPQHCYPGSGWDIEQSEPLHVRNFEGDIEELRRLVVRHNDRQDVVVYWYDTRTGRLSNDFKLKFNLMRTALLQLPQDAAFVRWSTPVAEDEDVDDATLRLLGVAARSLPDLDRLLPFGG